MFCEDNEPKAPETTHQKPDEQSKEITPEEKKKISEEMAKGHSTEADGD
jgi:hypothetical protein